MCRFLAYAGDPILLEDLVCKPSHSLVKQSLSAVQARTVTNGDGFGIGWYGERPEPGVYREVMPAWSDENLLSLCANVRSRCFLAHVRAATGGGIARQNCHPFHHGRYMLIHNGQIGGYAKLRRTLEGQLPDALFEHRRGATDSELLFLLIVQQLDAGLSAPKAIQHVLGSTLQAMQQAGIDEPLRFAAALTDGTTLWAIRWASDDQPPSLYTKPQAGGWAIASEPLGDDSEHWTPMAPGQVVRVSGGVMERVG